MKSKGTSPTHHNDCCTFACEISSQLNNIWGTVATQINLALTWSNVAKIGQIMSKERFFVTSMDTLNTCFHIIHELDHYRRKLPSPISTDSSMHKYWFLRCRRHFWLKQSKIFTFNQTISCLFVFVEKWLGSLASPLHLILLLSSKDLIQWCNTPPPPKSVLWSSPFCVGWLILC